MGGKVVRVAGYSVGADHDEPAAVFFHDSRPTDGFIDLALELRGIGEVHAAIGRDQRQIMCLQGLAQATGFALPGIEYLSEVSKPQKPSSLTSVIATSIWLFDQVMPVWPILIFRFLAAAKRAPGNAVAVTAAATPLAKSRRLTICFKGYTSGVLSQQRGRSIRAGKT